MKNANLEKVLAMSENPPDGPCVMVNLLKFKGKKEQERCISEIVAVFDEIASEVKAEIIYAGTAGPEFITGEKWDFVFLVRYPNYQAFADLIADPIWQEKAVPVREECLLDARLLLTTQAE